MGNLVGKRKLVHPIEGYEGLRSSSRPLRIKVVMTRKQLKKLMAMADDLTINHDLGTLIFQECCQGKLDTRVLTCV
uniref:Uncharacterized protein n=1 Tax=Cucumis melo TaxID=3656 RepID=A0A9I9DQX1_CUCME